jgi:ADP-ribosylglycohydrolase
MLGAICGDIIGSRFERFNYKGKDFQLFHESCRMTDDSILTLAIADAYMNNKDYTQTVVEYARENPLAGYGGSFINWVDSVDHKPYNSWGNGSAMRVSALSWLIDDMSTLMEEAKKSAEITHNHPEGIKGAQAIAAAVLLARKGNSKEEIKKYIEENFGYDLNRTVKFLNETYKFDVSCQGSVPEAIICFLESNDFEDCLRNAISIGGDSDTIASMASAIAEPFYKKIPNEIVSYSVKMISKNKKYMEVFEQFRNKI